MLLQLGTITLFLNVLSHKSFVLAYSVLLLLYTQGPYGATAMMVACEHPQGSRCVESLLRAKANANATDAGGRTALMYACARDNGAAVKELIRGGADAGAVDGSGWSALMYANHIGQSKVAGELVRALGKGVPEPAAAAPAAAAATAAAK